MEWGRGVNGRGSGVWEGGAGCRNACSRNVWLWLSRCTRDTTTTAQGGALPSAFPFSCFSFSCPNPKMVIVVVCVITIT